MAESSILPPRLYAAYLALAGSLPPLWGGTGLPPYAITAPRSNLLPVSITPDHA